jgi:hypothetical protein
MQEKILKKTKNLLTQAVVVKHNSSRNGLCWSHAQHSRHRWRGGTAFIEAGQRAQVLPRGSLLTVDDGGE